MTLYPVESVGAGTLTLKIPGQAEYVGIARLAVSGLASHLDVPYDEAEDLKLAVTEACTHLIRSAATRVQLQVACTFSAERLDIDVRGEATPFAAQPLDGAPPWTEDVATNGDPELGMYLLEALMDEVCAETDEDGTPTAVKMSMRLPSGV